MSTNTQVSEINELKSIGRAGVPSVEEAAAGQQPESATPAELAGGRTYTWPTSPAVSLVRRLKKINEPISAAILVSMGTRFVKTAPHIRAVGSLSNQAGRRSSSVASGSTLSTADSSPKSGRPGNRSRHRKETAHPKKPTPARRRRSSTAAVFVPRAKTKPIKIKPANSKANKYNTFRTNASKLLGTKIIKDCRNGTPFNSNISALWREVSEEDKAAFGDWTAAEQKEYLIRLATRPQNEERKELSTIQEKGIKAVTRVQPKRGVEGETKK